jgi:F-type H+-transporting ATPase subunit b
MEIVLTPEFWVAVSFFLFLGLVIYLGVHKKLAAALDARAWRIAKELDDARRLREEAEKVLADYRRREGDAVKEARGIIERAAKEAEILAAETRRSMKEYFDRRMKLAEDKIALGSRGAARGARGGRRCGRGRGTDGDFPKAHAGDRRQAHQAGHRGAEGKTELIFLPGPQPVFQPAPE